MLYILITLLIITTAFLAVYYLRPQFSTTNSTSESTPNNTGNTSTMEKDSSSAREITTEAKVAPTANDLYQSGNNKFAAKDYSGAIKDFDAAIAINNQVPEYYSRKSQAEYNLSNKNAAIKTLEDGLIANPGNDLLQSRLDVLQNPFINSQP